MKKKSKIVLIIVLSIMIIGGTILAFFLLNKKKQNENQNIQVSINSENGGVIVNRYSFLVRARLSMADGRGLREGDYTLNTSMTYEEILDKVLKSEVK